MLTLKQYRETLSLTQAEMGERLGVTAVTYGQWETGKRTPSATTLMRIADEFGATVHITSEGVFFLPEGEWTAPPPPSDDDPALGETID